MSFNDYIHDMTQKYRLAVAIAFLKGKPNELSIEQYIERLKTKYKNTDMDIDDELNTMVCSEDFRLDDDDIEVINDAFNHSFDDKETSDKVDAAKNTITNDFDTDMTQENLECVTRNDSFIDVFQTLRDIDQNVSTEKDNNTFDPILSTQSTLYEDSQLLELPATNTNIIEDVKNPKHNTDTDISEVLMNTEKTDQSIKTTVSNNKENNANNENRAYDNCPYESQATEIYSVAVSQNYTHVSQSQLQEIHIPRKYLYPKGHDIRNNENEFESNKTENGNVRNDITDIENREEQNGGHIDNAVNVDGVIKDVGDIDTLMHGDSIEVTNAQKTEVDDTLNFMPLNDIQSLQRPEANAKTENNKQLIQKLNENLNVNVDSSQIQYIIDKNGKMYRILHIAHKIVPNNIVFDHIISESQTKSVSKKLENFNSSNEASNNEEFKTNSQESNEKYTKEIEELNVTINAKDNKVTTTQETNLLITQAKETCKNNNPNAESALVTHAKETCNNNATTANISDVVDENISQKTNNEEKESESSSEFDDETTESQKEVVSFKVIEEMNRIKTFLSKNIERRNTDSSLTDSGYKSDSQKSVRNVQTPMNWLNQSAFCLYRHLLECPLINAAHEITREISQVLAKLVDKLHEDENYPPFLAELLGTIDKSIGELCHGESYGKDVLLKKDEMIQRLCLLSKSVHILKYTIEKLTDKLDIIYSNLTQNDTLYETANIDVCENVCYIFHALEICLQRYITVKQVYDADKQVQSQSSTQNSQDDEKEKLLKKSSIADIWRKKWIPNYKDDVTSDICMEKRCVLTKCGEILNKIIVGCMEGYSLVSFAALQCFNLLQNQ